jgi:hypothetical protein
LRLVPSLDRTHNPAPSGKFQRSMRRRCDHRGFCSARRSSSIHCAARRSQRSRSMGLFARSASVRHSSAALLHCSLSRFPIAITREPASGSPQRHGEKKRPTRARVRVKRPSRATAKNPLTQGCGPKPTSYLAGWSTTLVCERRGMPSFPVAHWALGRAASSCKEALKVYPILMAAPDRVRPISARLEKHAPERLASVG